MSADPTGRGVIDFHYKVVWIVFLFQGPLISLTGCCIERFFVLFWDEGLWQYLNKGWVYRFLMVFWVQFCDGLAALALGSRLWCWQQYVSLCPLLSVGFVNSPTELLLHFSFQPWPVSVLTPKLRGNLVSELCSEQDWVVKFQIRPRGKSIFLRIYV